MDLSNSAKRIWNETPNRKIEYDSYIKRLQDLASGNPETLRHLAEEAGLLAKAPRYGASERASRQFVAYDGEGFKDKYILLANSLGETVVNRKGLSTRDCLNLLSRRYDYPVFRVFYGFDYDVNHIVADLPRDKLDRLLDNEIVKYLGHTLQYFPGKIFLVDNLQYFDVVSFFQRSFISTVELMLGKDAVSQQLTKGKNARGNFARWSTERIIAYNDEELALLVRIMDQFREKLLAADIDLGSWHGPGAIANLWMKRKGIVTPKVPEKVEEALDAAYFGGRFEQIRLGKVTPVYEYDIRSAYPAAMSKMPVFGTWLHTDRYIPEYPFAIYRVDVDLRNWFLLQSMGLPVHQDLALGQNHPSATFMPLPMRNKGGIICFPMIARGWYWQKEIQLVLDFFPDARITIHEGYVAETLDEYPFSWITDMYNYRQELKRAGNLAEYGVKVGLNSLYGKTAQRVGRARYHSLAWAGFTTSSVRSTIARAGYLSGRNSGKRGPAGTGAGIVGFATDAIFSDSPLDLPCSSQLGDWEEIRLSTGTFIQSGVYRLQDKKSGEIIDRYRGNSTRNGLDDIFRQLTNNPLVDPIIHKQMFISHKMANLMPQAYGPYRLQFVRTESRVYIAYSFKRHYQFPSIPFDDGTIPVLGTILSEPIYSLPKPYMDVTGFNSSEFYRSLRDEAPDNHQLSYSSGRIDNSHRSIIDEITSTDRNNPYDDLDSILSLPKLPEPEDLI